MAKYHNREATKLIGNRLKQLRRDADLQIEDIVEMTGFHRNTIISIENGANTDLSHFIAYALALGKHPKECLDIPFEIKPRYKLSSIRKEKNRLTSRIKGLINEGFFKTPQTSKSVSDELIQKHPESKNITTKSTSVILMRLVDQEELRVKPSNNRNIYIATKKKRNKS